MYDPFSEQKDATRSYIFIYALKGFVTFVNNIATFLVMIVNNPIGCIALNSYLIWNGLWGLSLFWLVVQVCNYSRLTSVFFAPVDSLHRKMLFGVEPGIILNRKLSIETGAPPGVLFKKSVYLLSSVILGGALFTLFRVVSYFFVFYPYLSETAPVVALVMLANISSLNPDWNLPKIARVTKNFKERSAWVLFTQKPWVVNVRGADVCGFLIGSLVFYWTLDVAVAFAVYLIWALFADAVYFLCAFDNEHLAIPLAEYGEHVEKYGYGGLNRSVVEYYERMAIHADFFEREPKAADSYAYLTRVSGNDLKGPIIFPDPYAVETDLL